MSVDKKELGLFRERLIIMLSDYDISNMIKIYFDDMVNKLLNEMYQISSKMDEAEESKIKKVNYISIKISVYKELYNQILMYKKQVDNLNNKKKEENLDGQKK